LKKPYIIQTAKGVELDLTKQYGFAIAGGNDERQV
jgi:hypothetical protein